MSSITMISHILFLLYHNNFDQTLNLKLWLGCIVLIKPNSKFKMLLKKQEVDFWTILYKNLVKILQWAYLNPYKYINYCIGVSVYFQIACYGNIFIVSNKVGWLKLLYDATCEFVQYSSVLSTIHVYFWHSKTSLV